MNPPATIQLICIEEEIEVGWKLATPGILPYLEQKTIQSLHVILCISNQIIANTDYLREKYIVNFFSNKSS